MSDVRNERKPVRGGNAGQQPAAAPGRDGPMGPGRGGPMGGFGRPVEKAKNFKGTMARLAATLKPEAPKLLAVLGVSVIGTVCSVLGPKIMGLATTELFKGVMARFSGAPAVAMDCGFIGAVLLSLVAMYAASALFSWITQYTMAGIGQRVAFGLRARISEKMSKLPLKYFDGTSHGDILSRVTNDLDNVASTLQQSLAQVLSSVLSLIGIIVMMLVISPVMTLIAIAALPVYMLATQTIAKRSRKYFKDQQKTLGSLNGHIEEMYSGHRIVKAYGYERTSIGKFGEENDSLYVSAWKSQFISGIIMPVMNFISNVGYVLVCVAGGIMATGRLIALGDIQAFIQYTRQFSQPIIQTANIANILQSTAASAERVFELLDEAEESPDAETARARKVLGNPEGSVRFEGVTFSYRGDAKLIEGLSIQASPGDTVAIVGPTGAGKTTLVNLLMRFYEIGAGRIAIDGVDTREFSRGDLRGLFGMVLQDTWLFSGTIRENIAYARDDATEDEIVEAARAAYADHFVRTLPEGYDTVLDEEGANLSQGQRQLITIARAILADPEMLILDEATSSVDTRTEQRIQEAMVALMKGRTSFVIAHRLSTIKKAKTILVMDKGSIIEHGDHETLLAADGFYADLYRSQFLGAATD